ncbi:MAG: glucosyl-3-phosphoglycerate synthase, partial [Actinobacteria bacterium]
TIKNYLQEQYPLLDEIAIIDGDSKDRTVEIAKEQGVAVFSEKEVLADTGVQLGKGEALWKSIAALKGDIIAWIDTDIRNIDPHFVYGIIGPLLKYPKLQFSKAYYRRPIKVGETLKKTGGGRVTELVVRPIFNLFYPELAAFAQPLSGEYAGRRSLLETIPFYTGYAVETGLVVEIWRRLGLEAMAQVDLDERIHENQSTLALGKMSFEIIQAIFELLQEDGKLTLGTDINQIFQLVGCDNGKCEIEAKKVEVVKRIPMIEIEEYQKIKRKTNH